MNEILHKAEIRVEANRVWLRSKDAFSFAVFYNLERRHYRALRVFNDDKLSTFDALYPRSAYFGRVAYFGPSELIDVDSYLNTGFDRESLELDYAAFWRYSVEDGVCPCPWIIRV